MYMSNKSSYFVIWHTIRKMWYDRDFSNHPGSVLNHTALIIGHGKLFCRASMLLAVVVNLYQDCDRPLKPISFQEWITRLEKAACLKSVSQFLYNLKPLIVPV
ncbi:unnamed protein product [Fusarium fujikuroi]|nr:hypothetical protein CEK25_004274 [Fusarium fujikuroi]VZI18088.1 unnamed protein product [Fusarium fujikuroi]